MLEGHNICMLTITFERTKNQVKGTTNELVMVGNSCCKQRNLFFTLDWSAQNLHAWNRFRTHKESSETNKKWVSKGRISFRKQKDSAVPNLLHRKNLGDSARRIFLLAETIYYHHSVIYCSFLLIFGAFESDCMCADAVHCKCEIWSLIHFYRKLGPNLHFLPAAWD